MRGSFCWLSLRISQVRGSQSWEGAGLSSQQHMNQASPCCRELAGFLTVLEPGSSLRWHPCSTGGYSWLALSGAQERSVGIPQPASTHPGREISIILHKTKPLAFFFVLLMKLIKLYSKKQRLNWYETHREQKVVSPNHIFSLLPSLAWALDPSTRFQEGAKGSPLPSFSPCKDDPGPGTVLFLDAFVSEGVRAACFAAKVCRFALP